MTSTRVSLGLECMRQGEGEKINLELLRSTSFINFLSKNCVYNVSATQNPMLPGGHSLPICLAAALLVVPTFKTKISTKYWLSQVLYCSGLKHNWHSFFLL